MTTLRRQRSNIEILSVAVSGYTWEANSSKEGLWKWKQSLSKSLLTVLHPEHHMNTAYIFRVKYLLMYRFDSNESYSIAFNRFSI